MNLKGNPFYLNDKAIEWVKRTLQGMDVRTKVGQLFCLNIPYDDVRDMIEQLVQLDIKPCGFMSRPFNSEVVQENYRLLQQKAEIPLLLAANLERGGDGVCTDGLCFGTQMQIAATEDSEMSYKFGVVCAKEGEAVGCNWNFGPVLDIDFNPNNPITNTRTFGSNVDTILEMCQAYIKAMKEHNMAVSIKHWPGDGRDFRDQHMLATTNDMSVEEWDKTYGKIYKKLIDEGAQTVMSAHIMLPEYSKKLVKDMKEHEILPASLAKELNVDLLRKQLGFNGVVVTDATTMNGFMQVMKREEAIPRAIAAGSDILLFTCNLEEDFEYMLKGVEENIITNERLDEAVIRILALKASLKLHESPKGQLVNTKESLEIFGNSEHRQWAKECADQSITLVKDTQSIIPLDPKKRKRVLLHILGDVGGYHDYSRDHGLKFKKELEQEGFEVALFDKEDQTMWYQNVKIEELKQKYDLIIYFANIKTSGSTTNARITWTPPMSIDSPRYIHEIPTIFISVDNPYHLQDVPHIKTYINGYTPNEFVVEGIVEKLIGKSLFKGHSPVDPYCGLWNANL